VQTRGFESAGIRRERDLSAVLAQMYSSEIRGSDDEEASRFVCPGTPRQIRLGRAAWRPGGRWRVSACLLEGE
jgi:hypothetical protein